VEFDNESAGDYNRCEWDFGDDDDSDDCDDPTHTYRAAGEYTVRLKVSGPGGSDTKKREDYITVRLVADFTATPRSGPRPLVVNFTNLSPDYDQCEWAFGDGGVSYDCHPSHTYTAVGLYTVSLMVTEAGVRSDPEMKPGYITVISQPPVVSQPNHQNNAEGQIISLQIVATDPDGDGLTYSATNLPPDLSINPTTGLISGALSYTAENNSPYAVTVTVSDGAASTSVAFNWIVAHTNQAPTVVNPGDQNSAEGQIISLQIVATDPDGDLLTYKATNLPPDLSINPGSGLISGSLAATAAENSPYSVTVEVSDGMGAIGIIFNWTVSEAPQAGFTANPTSGQAPLAVQFTDQSTGIYDTCTWDFGDGAVSTEENPTHTYLAAGVYSVTLTVSGPAGSNVETKPSYITVTEPPIPTPTVIPTPTELPTPPPTPTDTPIPPTDTPTATPIPTDTPVPPTETPTATPTNTPTPTDTPTATSIPTDTPVPPTDTPTATLIPTATPVPPTDTATATPTDTPTMTPTATSTLPAIPAPPADTPTPETSVPSPEPPLLTPTATLIGPLLPTGIPPTRGVYPSGG
jgi:PKD repeat protein